MVTPTSPPSPVAPPASRQPPRCVCGGPLFLDNTVCLTCGAPVGFLPDEGLLTAFRVETGGLWRRADGPQTADAPAWRPCAQRTGPHGCDWLVPAAAPQPLCLSCQLTRTHPNLSVPGNAERWARAERPKRRVIAQLLRLGLPVAPLPAEPGGVCFDFLQNLPGMPPVLTGHLNGVITINLNEADDAQRESMRQKMGETFRTMAGHLRHELAHYYWMLLARDPGWLATFRQEFGDDRSDYASALARHHQHRAPADWALRHVSAYASSHPWEDWAETFAHYLHLDEALFTARQSGMDPDRFQLEVQTYSLDLIDPGPADVRSRDAFIAGINRWIRLSVAVNELSRALGHADAWPFVLNSIIIRKLWAVHTSIEILTQRPRKPPIARRPA